MAGSDGVFHADLHVHSRFSRACSKACDIPGLAWWAARKGITVVGTGDFTHPAWAAELSEFLVPAEPGLLRLASGPQGRLDRTLPPSCRRDVRFLLSAEISTIYRYGEATRKVHHLVYAPTFEAARSITDALGKVGNLASDGRPILGLDSRHLLDITLNAGPGCFLVPAHIWTPWFAVLGSKSGFATVAECYGDLADHVFAVETGLSSDPPMNWMCSALDRYRLVSNSDAHSPPMLGREATTFSTRLDYFAMAEAMRTGEGLAGTLNFFPEGGRYHLDGHRKCGARLDPAETKTHGGICPRCGKPLTIGVLHRVSELADRPAGHRPSVAADATNLVSLPEIVAEIFGTGPQSKKVRNEVDRLVAALGPELSILCEADVASIGRAGGSRLGEAVARLRRGEVIKEAGYDGEYGVIRLFGPGELTAPGALFEVPAPAEEISAKRLKPATPGPSGLTAARAPQAPEPAVRAPEPAPHAVAPAPHAPEPAPHAAEPAVQAPEPAPHAAEPAPHAPEPAGLTTGSAGEMDGPGGPSAARSQAPARSDPSAPPPRAPVSRSRAGTQAAAPAPVTVAETLLAGLDPDQRAAAVAPSPLMIIAGPGTGKTSTLTHRIVARAEMTGVPLSGSLALTFTRRAAEQLRDRLARLTAGHPGPTVTTFHGLGLMILREHGAEAGLAAGFEVADEQARLAVAAELTGSRQKARRMLAAAARDPARRAEFAGALAARNLVDFDGLVEVAAALLRDDHELAGSLRERWPVISVDEYQDIDATQYALLRLLAGDGSGLTVIGDPDQSIYGFRGADVGFFLRFGRDYPGATVARLTRNYRSPPAVVAGALQAVAPSTLVPGRVLRPTAGGARQPGRILLHEAASEHDEATWIAEAIDRLLGGVSFHSLDTGRADGHAGGRLGLADMAVLYRTDAQASALGQALTRAGLPFQKRSHDLLTRRVAVPEIVHEMRVGPAAGSPVAARLAAAVHRLAGQAGAAPAARVDLLAAGEVLAPLARRCGSDLERFVTEIALGAETDSLDPRADAVTLLTLHAAKGLEFGAVFLAGCERGLLPLWIPGAKARAAAARAAGKRAAGERPGNGEPGNGEPGNSDRRAGAGDPDLAEERRLLFVGMTRARNHLILTCAARRRRHGQTRDTGPSPFLDPIDSALLDRSARAARRPAPTRQNRLF